MFHTETGSAVLVAGAGSLNAGSSVFIALERLRRTLAIAGAFPTLAFTSIADLRIARRVVSARCLHALSVLIACLSLLINVLTWSLNVGYAARSVASSLGRAAGIRVGV